MEYVTLNNGVKMPIVTSRYWNMVHGTNPEFTFTNFIH